MDLNKIENVYFIGIGGIGMSALARYFLAIGKTVSGYDRTATTLTSQISREGVDVHFVEDIHLIPPRFFDNPDKTLVVYTPAVPKNHTELVYFRNNNFNVYKRSEVLGQITREKFTIAVAGTHGKTTISTMLAHILSSAGIGSTAFLGGISKNFRSNMVIDPNSEYMIVEADEFDRSFLCLFPSVSIISSVDADHMDIYGTLDELQKAFCAFARQLKVRGRLIHKQGIQLTLNEDEDFIIFKYDIEKQANFYAKNIRVYNGVNYFDIVTPSLEIQNCSLGVSGKVNIENSVAAVAVAVLLGIGADSIRQALRTYSGVKRRFDYQINLPDLVYIDDYAHHPEELRATIDSVRDLYPDRKITAVFQPHLYSRTRDFADDFARELSKVDKLFLLDIYPAREEPVPGVTSRLIFDKITDTDKILCSHEEMVNLVVNSELDILLTLGAGDIDTRVDYLKKMIMARYESGDELEDEVT